MSGLIIAGWFPRKRSPGRPRKATPPLASQLFRLVCGFCRNTFERETPQPTCSHACAAHLRQKQAQQESVARFKAAHAAKWLTFPKEAIDHE